MKAADAVLEPGQTVTIPQRFCRRSQPFRIRPIAVESPAQSEPTWLWVQRGVPWTWPFAAFGIGCAGAALYMNITTSSVYPGFRQAEVMLWSMAILTTCVAALSRIATQRLEMHDGLLTLYDNRITGSTRKEYDMESVRAHVHTVEIRSAYSLYLSWRGYAVIAWFPDGERFVFACLTDAEDAKAYASAMPEPWSQLCGLDEETVAHIVGYYVY